MLCEAAASPAGKYAPEQALWEWIQRFVGYVATKRGMSCILRTLLTSDSDLCANTSGRVPRALGALLDATAPSVTTYAART